MKKNLFVVLIGVIFAFGLFVFSQSAEAEKSSGVKKEETVRAEGSGVDANAAKLDSFRNAIAQVVGMYVRSDTVVEDFVTKSDKIKTKCTGFIKKAKKLDEKKGDGIVNVVYEVTVSTEPVQQDLKEVVGAEFESVGHPTVCVVGYYKGRDREETEINVAAVTAMNRALIKRGYKVVDQWTIDKLRTEDAEIVKQAAEATKDNFDQVALAIANNLKADIYVTTFGSVSSGKASVSTKMYSSYTAQIFGDDTGYANMTGSTLADAKKAVEGAVGSSMERILNQVSTYWQNLLNEGAEYIVVLENYKDGKVRRKFKELLKKAEGVEKIKELNAAGKHAEYSVYVKDKMPGDFFDDLIGAMEDTGMKVKNDEAVMRGGRAIFILVN